MKQGKQVAESNSYLMVFTGFLEFGDVAVGYGGSCAAKAMFSKGISYSTHYGYPND